MKQRQTSLVQDERREQHSLVGSSEIPQVYVSMLTTDRIRASRIWSHCSYSFPAPTTETRLLTSMRYADISESRNSGQAVQRAIRFS